jgi:WD40 repeat protein/transcriptional regulator with XRE-family HTH domain
LSDTPPCAKDVTTLTELAGLLRALRRREARRRGGSTLTYRELAAKTGWSRGIIGEYFAGNVLPPTDRFDELVRLLGAGPSEQGELATARDRVEEARRGAPPAALPCPYRGLSAFGEQDAPLFFGREELTDRLVNDIRRKPLVALVGASGSGKSSVVFAGAVSRLRRAGWSIAELRPGVGDSPVSALADAIDRLERPGSQRTLLVVDQFEELFAYDTGVVREFIDVLLQPVGSLTVVLTLRADFLGQALEHARLAERLQGSTLTIGRMSGAQLRRAIESPLPDQVGYEPGLVERILTDLGDEPGRLPLLQFALTMLWARRQDRCLTHAAYEELGGVAAALGRYAEDVYHNELKADERQVARLFVQLVRPTGHPTRRVARHSELDESQWTVAQRLAATRLVTTGTDVTGGETVELAHEALISEWGRLRHWVDGDRDFRAWQERLRTAIDQYETSGRDEGALLRGVPLAEAQRWLTERATDLCPTEREYILASRALQGRTTRRLRVFAAGLAVLLLVASALGIGAERQRRMLRVEERLAASQAIAAHADATIETRPVESVLLSVQAYDEADTVEARGSLLRHVVEHTHTAGFLIGHTSRVSAVAFSPDGHTVATASVDGTARLWDAGTHQVLATLTGHANWLRAVAFSPDGRLLATGSDDRTVRLWDVAARAPVVAFTGHQGPVRAVAFSPDGRTLAAAGDDRTVRLWDVATRRTVTVLSGHLGAVRGVAFSPDGRVLATASFDGTVRLWSTATWRELAVLSGHNGWVLGVAFSPDGRTLASAGADHTIRLWDVAAARELAALAGHTDMVLSVAFSPDGRTVASASADRTARIWDVATRTGLTTLTGHGGWVTGVAFGPRGDTLATSSDDLTARLWDVRPSRGLTMLPGTAQTVMGLAYSPDGRTLATGGDDSAVRLWEVGTRRPLAVLSGHSDHVRAVAFSPDGRTIASASDDRTVRLWDVANRRQPAVLTGHSDHVRAVAFSPDGRTIASASDDRTVRLWDVANHRPLAVLTGHTGEVTGVTFSPDGRTLATVSEDHTARLWDVGTRRPLAVLSGHTDKVSTVAFGPDGRTLVTAGEDSTVRLWDVASRRSSAILTGHTGWVWTATFSRDGRTLATAADDGTVRLWDVTARRELASLAGHSDSMPRAAFSPDGHSLAAVDAHGTILLWETGVTAWRQMLCEVAGRNLTRTEWHEFLPGRPYQRTCPDEPADRR